MTPIAPMSSTLATKWYSVAGMRTIGTSSDLGVVAISMRIVSILQPECSMSKTANSAPALAAIRAMPVVLNSNSIVPIETFPSRSLCLTALRIMRRSWVI